MRNFFMLMSVAALVACGDKDDDSGDSAGVSGTEWCADYFSALEGCYGEAGFSAADYGLDEDTYCANYQGITDIGVKDLLCCYVDAIEDADCSTGEGIESMSTAANACAG